MMHDMHILTISTKNPSSVIVGTAECQVLLAGTLENISLHSEVLSSFVSLPQNCISLRNEDSDFTMVLSPV